MPRAAWVAIGVVVCALLVSEGEPETAELPAARIAAALAVAGLVLCGVAGRGRRFVRPVAFAAGVLLVAMRLAMVAPDGSAACALPSESGRWTGRVTEVGSPADGAQKATIEIAVGAAGESGERGECGGHLVLVAATLPRYPELAPAMTATVEGRLEAPGDDDYGAYLRRRGIAATLRSRTLDAKPGDTGLPSAIEGLRSAIVDALRLSLPEPLAGLASGILVGRRDVVDRDLAAAFTASGLSHVVAISGWNISIVGAIAASLGRRFGRRRRLLLVLGAIVGYTLLAGASASVLRAALMAAVAIGSRESGRGSRAMSSLAWAVVLLVSFEPATVRDAGFQLSVLATAGIVTWGSEAGRFLATLGRDRLPATLTESLGLSLAAQLATLPIVLVTFGRLALLSPLANLVVAPLVPIAMAGGTLAIAGGAGTAAGLPHVFGAILGMPGTLSLGLLVVIVQVTAAMPGSGITLPPPFDVAAAALSALVILLVAERQRLPARLRAATGTRTGQAHRRESGTRMQPGPGLSVRLRPLTVRRLGLVAGLVAAGGLTLGGITAAPAHSIRVTVLDVGQGDAILLEGNRGTRLLVDGGPSPEALLGALGQRLAPWDRRIDVVVLTHPHDDHVGGLPAVIERYDVGRIFEPGLRGTGPAYAEWTRVLAQHGRNAERLAAGDHLAIDDLALGVLWPDPGSIPAETPSTGTGINDVSIVLLGSFGSQRLLLTGDAEQEVDETLVDRGLPHVDLLKVAHHGSATATTQPLLDATRPTVAAISVGTGNTYGHPTRATLGRLEAIGARVMRTDLSGTLDVRLDGAASIATAATGSAGSSGSGRGSVLTLLAPTPNTAARLLYHRSNGDPGTRRRGSAPPLPRSTAVVPAPRPCRGGDRRLARRARRRARAGLRSDDRRDRGPPPRRGQASAARALGPTPPAWRGCRGLAR